MSVSKDDAKKAMKANSSIYILHAAIAVLEQLPSGSPVDSEKVKGWIEEMSDESQVCLGVRDEHVSP